MWYIVTRLSSSTESPVLKDPISDFRWKMIQSLNQAVDGSDTKN